MGIVKIDGLSISFGKHKVLKDISLQIEKGEFVTILGPNGSGHSMGGQSGRVSDEGKGKSEANVSSSSKY